MEVKYTFDQKLDSIKECLLKAKSTNPVSIITEIMNEDFVNMHGPEHHFLDGGSFLVAIHNTGLDFDLIESLDVLRSRAIKMPGAMCGHWGVCGSVASIGAALSILHQVGPLSNDKYYSDDMEFTSSVIKRMSEIGGPRCCKRNAFLSISYGVDFVKEKYGIILEKSHINCSYSHLNGQCKKEDCPYYKK